MPNDNNTLVVGSASVGGSVYEPWPTTWQYPVVYNWPYAPGWYAPEQDYANEVEIERGEHDVTLHFYRSSGPNKGKTLVKTVTIPLSVLDFLAEKD